MTLLPAPFADKPDTWRINVTQEHASSVRDAITDQGFIVLAEFDDRGDHGFVIADREMEHLPNLLDAVWAIDGSAIYDVTGSAH